MTNNSEPDESDENMANPAEIWTDDGKVIHFDAAKMGIYNRAISCIRIETPAGYFGYIYADKITAVFVKDPTDIDAHLIELKNF
jgi:hypothetical protein